MKKSKLDEIKKELEKVIEFREGTGRLKETFFGKYQGTSVNLTYAGDYSNVWIGKMGNDYKIDLSMSLPNPQRSRNRPRRASRAKKKPPRMRAGSLTFSKNGGA